MDVLTAILRSLSPRLEPAGFERSDEAWWEEVEWIEYRSPGPGGPALLGITHVPHRRIVLAEFWPRALPVELQQAGPPEREADRCYAWQYDGQEDPEPLARAVAETVADWVISADQSTQAARVGSGRPR